MPSGASETAVPGLGLVGKNLPMESVGWAVVLLSAILEESRDTITLTAAMVRINTVHPRSESEWLFFFCVAFVVACISVHCMSRHFVE